MGRFDRENTRSDNGVKEAAGIRRNSNTYGNVNINRVRTVELLRDRVRKLDYYQWRYSQ